MRKIIEHIFALILFTGFVSLLLAVNALECDGVTFRVGISWAAISLGATGLGAWGMNKLTNEEELRKEWE